MMLLPVLYVSDLDGTLLQPGAVLSPYAFDILSRLLDEGMLFTVASARSVASMRPILGDLPLSLPVIEFNGAFLSDYRTGRHLDVCSIGCDVMEAVIEELSRGGQFPCISTFHDGCDNLYIPERGHRCYESYRRARIAAGDPRLRDEYDLQRGLDEQVVCLTFMDEEECLRDLQRRLTQRHPENLQTYLQLDGIFNVWWLTVYSPEVCKSKAIRRLCKFAPNLAGLQVTAFGDAINDLALIRAADIGIAVANADPEVKDAARLTIAPNTDDAVVRYLETQWSAVSA